MGRQKEEVVMLPACVVKTLEQSVANYEEIQTLCQKTVKRYQWVRQHQKGMTPEQYDAKVDREIREHEQSR